MGTPGVTPTHPPRVGCVRPHVIVEPWLLLSCQWEGITLWADWLHGLAGTTMEEAVHGSIPWSRTYFSRGLVPTESSPLVLLVEVFGWCFGVVYSCPQGALALGLPMRWKPRSAATCALPESTQHELQSSFQMAATCVWLGGTQDRPNPKQRPVAACTGSGTTLQEAHVILRPGAACFERLRKVWSLSRSRLCVWKSHWEHCLYFFM